MRYFDANATTSMTPKVVAEVARITSFGPLNPSSAHSIGEIARAVISDARDAICNALGGDDPDNLIFVSGGTEGNNIVLNGFSRISDAVIFYSAVEHASVAEPASVHGGLKINVGRDGIVDLRALAEALGAISIHRPVLVCVQVANSETGVVQPIEEIAALCATAGPEVFLHVDAAQAFGRISFPVGLVDSITMSGHKLHAPSGSGFLYLSDRMAERLPRTVLGGGQERGIRSGTENVVAIAGLAAAISERFSDFDGVVATLAGLRNQLERSLLQRNPDLLIVGAESYRTPNTTSIIFPGVDAMALMAHLDELGIICSNGSACSSRKPSPSKVLTSMGIPERQAFSCLRFSFSIQNNSDEIQSAAADISSAYRKLKALHEYR